MVFRGVKLLITQTWISTGSSLHGVLFARYGSTSSVTPDRGVAVAIVDSRNIPWLHYLKLYWRIIKQRNIYQNKKNSSLFCVNLALTAFFPNIYSYTSYTVNNYKTEINHENALLTGVVCLEGLCLYYKSNYLTRYPRFQEWRFGHVLLFLIGRKLCRNAVY